jgi:glycosyltransferase involved in cell wall biosynthesis
MRPLVLDVSRLLTGLRFGAPTGVETLELGLARHLPPGPGLALTPWGARTVSAATRDAIAGSAETRWCEAETDAGLALAQVAAFLRGEPVSPSKPAPDRSLLAAARFLPRLLKGPGQLPNSAVTVHTGFFRLEQPTLFKFKAVRTDLKTIIAFHDILPLKHPNWFRPGESELHRARLTTALGVADAITVAAESVRADITQFAARAGLTLPRIAIVDLPVARRFADATPPAFAAPYMLICGTIEPRKNHGVLLEAWRRLGAKAPTLIIAGRRGWRNDDVFVALDAKPANVLELPDLSSAALASLVKGASALLSPSHDEGFGLPVAEALAAGTPVIAADTPVYRELWSGRAKLIDPGDADAWAEAVLAPPPRGAPFSRSDWPTYVSTLTALAGTL